MKPFYFLFVFFASFSCDRKSAVDSNEFLSSRMLFSSGKITRCTLYLRSYKPGEHYWKESELKKNTQAVTVTGENAEKIWNSLENEVSSSVTRSALERNVDLPIIFENKRKEKYQMRIVKVSQKDKVYLYLSFSGGENPRWIGLDERDLGGLTSNLLSFSRNHGVDLR